MLRHALMEITLPISRRIGGKRRYFHYLLTLFSSAEKLNWIINPDFSHFHCTQTTVRKTDIQKRLILLIAVRAALEKYFLRRKRAVNLERNLKSGWNSTLVFRAKIAPIGLPRPDSIIFFAKPYLQPLLQIPGNHKHQYRQNHFRYTGDH